MKNDKADRRAERTCRMLEDALMALMLEKRYDRITVQDIIDRANVGRSTFYAHYRDKEDLFVTGFGGLFDNLSRQIEPTSDEGKQILPTLELFRHIQEQYRLYKALVWGRAIDLVFKTGQQQLSKSFEKRLDLLHREKPKLVVPLPIISEYLAGALLTLLRWWLENKMPYSPEQMDEMFQRLVMPGVSVALNTEL